MNAKFILKVATRIMKEHELSLLVQEIVKLVKLLPEIINTKKENNKDFYDRMFEKLTNKEDETWIEYSVRDYKENYNFLSDKEKQEKFDKIFNVVKTWTEGFAMILLLLPEDNTIKGIIKKQKLEDLFNYYQSMKEELLKFKTCA